MKKNWLFILVTLLSVGFISCSENDEISERNEEKLFRNFIGEWTYSAEILYENVKTEIQGEIKYNLDKTVEVEQSHYKNGELYLQNSGEFHGSCFITMRQDYYELNTEVSDGVIPFDDIRFGYNGKYERSNNYNCIFDIDNGIISIVDNNGHNMVSKISLKKKQ